MKQSTKIISILMAIVLLAGSFFIFPLSASAETVQTRTVMLYLVGSNLEEEEGAATWNLVQSMEAEYDENLNFIVMTGGANKWHTEAEYLSGAEAIKPEVNQIWKLEGKRGDEAHGKMTLLEPEGIEGFERASMSDCATMTAFIDYCYHNYPSDLYDIILWDHGGGPAYGFGMDFRDKDIHVMSLSQNVKAFSDSSLIKDGKNSRSLTMTPALCRASRSRRRWQIMPIIW